MSSLPTQRTILKPLISSWLSIAVKSLMSLGENHQRRIWFIIDELATLNKIPILMQGLAELRRFGGCFILSFQDLQQLDAFYGEVAADEGRRKLQESDGNLRKSCVHTLPLKPMVAHSVDSCSGWNGRGFS
jgi:hypothetical protein